MPVKKRVKKPKTAIQKVGNFIRKELPDVLKTVGISVIKKQLGLGSVKLAGSGHPKCRKKRPVKKICKKK
jgi:hypothetical protein